MRSTRRLITNSNGDVIYFFLYITSYNESGRDGTHLGNTGLIGLIQLCLTGQINWEGSGSPLGEA